MAIKLGEELKKQLSAVVEMAPNPNITLVKEAVAHGIYRGIPLLKVQTAVLKYFPSLAEHPKHLNITGVYNPETFQTILERLSEQGYYETVKKAVWNDDPTILSPDIVDPNPQRPSVGELVPPHFDNTQASQESIDESAGVVQQQEEEQAQEQQHADHTPSSESNIQHSQPHYNQPPPQRNTLPQRPEKTPEQIQQDTTQRQELKDRMRRSQTPAQGPAGEPRPKNALPERSNRISSQTRKKVSPRSSAPPTAAQPTTSPAGSLLKSRNRRRALASILKGRAAPGFGFPTWVPKIFQRLASSLARTAANLASNLIRGAFNMGARALAQLLPRLGAQAGLAVGRSLLAPAVVVVAANPLTWIILGITAVIGSLIWFNYTANMDCDKPMGEMRVQKRFQGRSTSDAENPSVENGQKIDYIVEMSYELACQGRTLQNVTVTDKIPTNTTYFPGSARSGFYNTDQPGPEGIYDATTDTVTWTFTNFPVQSPVYIYLSVTPNDAANDSWVMNQATVKYTVNGTTGGATGGKIINSSSQSFEQAVAGAAQNVSMPPALLKAILSVEASGVFEYSEEEFRRFSTPGWWENADPASLKRGYAYNTCADPTAGCGAGNDVQGVAQFLSTTWDSVAQKLQFADGHKPDRRNATDAIYGSAIYNRQNAELYVGSSNVNWTEDEVRAVARMYCAGPGAAKNPGAIRVKACGWDGTRGYDDFVWRNYQQFLGG